MEAILTLVALAILLVALSTLGVDSRDGNDWIWHSRP